MHLAHLVSPEHFVRRRRHLSQACDVCFRTVGLESIVGGGPVPSCEVEIESAGVMTRRRPDMMLIALMIRSLTQRVLVFEHDSLVCLK